ncbi:MAG: extracellular solute-binding protein [Alphaproteobacteria bacterium]|nr:extracellular solute-binding protein [Alphaproteobacteria bacterium]
MAGAGLTMVAMPLVTRDAEAEATPNLTILEWNGYEAPEFHPEYAKKYSGSPSYSFFSDEEEALQKILAGFNPDLSHPCTASIRRWKDAGAIKPIDTKRIERWGEIMPELFSAKGMVIDGEHYMMPWDFGFSQIVYNPDILPLDKPTYGVMVDEAYAGKVSMNSQLDVVVAVGGIIAGNKNIFDPSDAEIDRLVEVWRQMVKTSRFLWSDATEIEQAMASKEIGAAYLWTSSLAALRKQGLRLEVIPPLLPWICGFVINTKGPGDEQQAYDYLNAMLDPVGGKASILANSYAHPNPESYVSVDKVHLRSYGIEDPIASLKEGIFFDEIPAAKREKLIALWDKVRAGL